MDIIPFLVSTCIALILWGGIVFYKNKTNPIKYLKEKKGVWFGIKFALIFTLVSACIGGISGCSGNGTYLKDGTAYMGLDYPMTGRSPQCLQRAGEIDDRTTSNLGVRINVYESESGNWRANAKYTHHSCAFNSDIRVYDALGIEFETKLFER